MCLGVPGKVVRVDETSVGVSMGQVSFGGVLKEICLAYTPEVKVGDYVLVHVGFAISKIDEDHANEVLEALRQIGELSDAPEPQAAAPGAPPSDEPAPAG
ncbi:HypC/HybG/HupF family hydrogenase formation chaperone [Acidobacteria bacterium ACD]|nr:MAG: HypC/HybG/HupF family hydrogenase formation chaperone [Acidobacteriota bacterium]MCE7959590.1 HypC/HybG/HupF family hydrogenase formation chaperone [Acidobacteria bacterium ACB2]MDL1951409.1 HypC/HybG/HupF family hydrogenase formation chaperone [Acidobacteria bacterium ACD]